MVFFAAQSLVALRLAGLGAFFFYSSTNIYLMFTAVPYLLFWPDPHINGLILCTITAASLSFITASIFLIRALSPYREHEKAKLGPTFRTGSIIAISRMLQAMIYWIPVWICGALLGPADASVLATAGRLLVAVSAVIAALRFSVRPMIVSAAAKSDWSTIENSGRRIALFTTLLTLAAMLLMVLIGRPILLLLFGPAYSPVWGVLFILLFGALGEAFGGPVDEVLKMTGHSPAVFFGLIVTIISETVLSIALSSHGIQAIAAAQSAAFCIMYGYQVAYLRYKRKILIMPVRVGAFRKHK
jgi:O-antigen/teichoic acid export membrane protein